MRTITMLQHWLAVARERAALAELSAAALADIGVARADAQAEAGRPFWDTPPERQPGAARATVAQSRRNRGGLWQSSHPVEPESD